MHISNKPKEETFIVKISLMIQSGLVSYTHLNVKYFQRTSSLAGSHAELVVCHLRKKSFDEVHFLRHFFGHGCSEFLVFKV